MDLLALLAFTGVYFAAVATPGPGVAAVIARVMGQGMRNTLPFVAGFIVGDLVWLTIAATGLAVIAKTFETLFIAIKYAGCVYLLYLAWKIWTAPVRVTEIGEAPAAADRPWSAFLGSLMLTLGNPKVIVFFLSIMPLVVDPATITLLAFAELAIIVPLVIGPTMLGYALVAERARRMFRSEKAMKRINRGTGALMAGVAATIAAR